MLPEPFSALLTVLSSGLAIYLGGLIKRSEASNKWIPWLTLVISFVNQVVVAAGGVANAMADSLSVAAPAAAHASLFSVFLSILVKSVIQAVGITGGVSFVKNGVLGRVSESRSYS